MLRNFLPLLVVLSIAGIAYAAPVNELYRSVIPETTDTFYIGTSSPSTLEYNGIFTKNLTVSGTCTGCGSSGSGTVSTSTIPTVGQLPYWTSNGYPSLLGSVATSSPTAGAGIILSGTGSVVGGSLTITNSIGYPFPNQLGGGNATSSLTGFSGGILATASSTFTGLLQAMGNATTSMLSVNNQIYLTGISSPAAPPSGQLELYGVTTQGITRPVYQDGCTEITLGRDNVTVIRNTSAATINKGDVVDVTGSTGNVPNVALAQSGAGTTAVTQADGVVLGGIGSNSIGVNNYGCMMKLGIETSLNTSAYTSDTMLYLSTTTPGAVVGYKPSWPDVSDMIGVVLVSGVGNGSVLYHVSSTLHNADTGTVNNSYGIGGFGGGSRSLIFANGVGTTTLSITPSGTIAQTIPNVAGTFVLGTGSTGNCAQWSATNVLTNIANPCGTVTAVTGTWPIISSGGATPNLTFGWATTTQPSSSNLFVSNGTNGFYGVATTTLVAGTNVSFSGGIPVVIGSSPVTISATGGSSFAYPFNTLTNYGTTTAATTTMPWFQQGLFASSTSVIASTTFSINGNVGIGTSTPGSLLSIQGIANFTTATSTFYGNGLNLTNGCFAINGTCVGAGGGSGTVGSGTTGQFPYYAANGTTLTATSSIFLNTNQFVGIGTTTPKWNLQIAGTHPSLALSDMTAAANLKHWLFTSMGGNLYIGTSTDAYATTSQSALSILDSVPTAGSQTFTSSGTFTAPAGVTTVTVFLVGGGGGSGSGGGGGGGGGVIVPTVVSVTAGSNYSVTVGTGGTAATAGNSGGNGNDSVAFGLTATGGGGGGGVNAVGANGGSGGGGGGSAAGRAGGTGVVGQGNNGGAGPASATPFAGGGGGGYSAVGSDGVANNTGGAGGNGYTSSISGSSVTYGCGGGGWTANTGGTGGAAGCSNAGAGSDTGNAGTANTGGGAGASIQANAGKAGGSGIVIVTYTTQTNHIESSLPFLIKSTAIGYSPLFSVGTSTALMSVDLNGHLITAGNSPTCGTGCSSVIGDDNTMRVTAGSSVSAITVNFANSWTTTPVCIANEESGGVVATNASSTPTAVTINTASAVTSVRFAVSCKISNNLSY